VTKIKFSILLSTSLVFFLLLVSFSSATITCDSCVVNNCQCSITDFSSGTFGVYSTSDCSGFPTVWYTTFSGGTVTWSPAGTGTFYLKAYHGSDKSDCITQQVPSTVTTTSSSTSTTTQGGVCVGCGGTICQQESHICTATSSCCEGLSCIQGICQLLTTTTTSSTTTTTPTTTTTTVAKKECPYDCCEDEEQYENLKCQEGYFCQDNVCIKTEAEGESGTGIPMMYIVVIVVVAITAFVVFFVLKRKQDDWKKLYDKWSARPNQPRR